MNTGQDSSDGKAWDCKHKKWALQTVLGLRVQFPLEVTFLLNLFCSNTILADLTEWSIYGKPRLTKMILILETPMGLMGEAGWKYYIGHNKGILFEFYNLFTCKVSARVPQPFCPLFTLLNKQTLNGLKERVMRFQQVRCSCKLKW